MSDKRFRELGVIENPYAPYPDDRYFIPLTEQREVYQVISALVSAKHPAGNVGVVVGDSGFGKSVLARRLINAISADEMQYLSAVGVLISDRSQGTPSRILKNIVAVLGLANVKAADRVSKIKEELEQRMFERRESLFITYDAPPDYESLSVLSELLEWKTEAQGHSLVQVAFFGQENDFHEVRTALYEKAFYKKVLLPPARDEITGLLETISRMALRSSPLFASPALNLIVNMSQQVPGAAVSLANQAFINLVLSDKNIIDGELVESL